jgi:hypothetical protein
MTQCCLVYNKEQRALERAAKQDVFDSMRAELASNGVDYRRTSVEDAANI